ncbi:MAG TPA: hypothetical protein VMT30_04215 [Candidatus Saccharimonadia bacterium]|nr:hypothetical protein [Candidatus Saccharimonadia bacterium]
MHYLPYSRPLSLIVGFIGAITFIFGLYYNASNFLNFDASPSLASLLLAGYALLAIAPLFVRAYKITITLLTLAAITGVWLAIG